MNASPAAVPSTASTARRRGARDLLAVLEQDRAFGAERDGDDAVAMRQRLELEPVHDRHVGSRHGGRARVRR